MKRLTAPEAQRLKERAVQLRSACYSPPVGSGEWYQAWTDGLLAVIDEVTLPEGVVPLLSKEQGQRLKALVAELYRKWQDWKLDEEWQDWEALPKCYERAIDQLTDKMGVPCPDI